MTFFSEQEFKHFYLSTFPSVRTYVFSKCGDMDLAEDLAQESFLRLWNHQSKIEKEKARSFLFTVANNLFLDHVRHHKVKNNYNNTFVGQNERQDPQFLIEMDEFKQKLESTIQRMPEGAREVFLLNRIERLTYAQIAENLGLSVKAIEKRMQKALEIFATLRKKS